MEFNKDEFIKQSLSHFLKKHSEEASISAIDDIVLSYMISILEDLGSPDATEESFDCDSFSEMMDAYLPGFCNIQSVDVCEWMFELASQMSDNNREKENKPPVILEARLSDILKSPPVNIQNGTDKTHHHRARKSSRTSSTSSESCSSPIVYLEAESPASFKDGQLSDHSVDDDQVDLLLEMFPSCCRIEVAHCLNEAEGDMETAVQLLIRNEEARDGLAQSMPKMPHKVSKKKDNSRDDKKMKDSILEKYSYIDLDEDKRTFRPPPQKKEPKKMVRYLDGKVVTTKGERFTEMKKDEDAEPKKKTSKGHARTRSSRASCGVKGAKFTYLSTDHGAVKPRKLDLQLHDIVEDDSLLSLTL